MKKEEIIKAMDLRYYDLKEKMVFLSIWTVVELVIFILIVFIVQNI